MTRSSLLFVSIFLGTAIGALNTAAQSAPSFTLKLTEHKQEFRAGDDVSIAISLTNTSDREIDAYNSSVNGVDNAYNYDIRDEDGNAVAKVPWTKPVPPPESYHLNYAQG